MGVRAAGGPSRGSRGPPWLWPSLGQPPRVRGWWVLQQGQGRRRLSTATAEDQTSDFGFLY